MDIVELQLTVDGMAQAFQIEKGWAEQLAAEMQGFGRVPKTDEDLIYDFETDPARAVQSVTEKYGPEAAEQYVKYIQSLRGKAQPVAALEASEPAVAPPTPVDGGY